MKKILQIILVSISFSGIMHAQTYSFVFSQFNSAYTPLVGGTNVYGTTPWTNSGIGVLPMGMNFNFQGQNQTVADIIPGIVAFPTTVDNMGIYAFYASLADTGLVVSKSPVTYLTTGTAGNHIFKIQCADAGFSNEYSIDSVFSSVVNFQAWFYEADNSIEVHVGPSVITNPLHCYLDTLNPGPSIGPIQLDVTQTSILYSLALTGNPAAPTLSTYNISSMLPASLNSTPANGTVYRFAQVVSGINENEKVFSTAGLFPNPSNENSILVYGIKNSGDVKIEITDVEGKIISSVDQGNQIEGNYHFNLNTSEFANGIYFVSLVSGEQKITQKLAVAH